jgi:hypothetical protein
MNVFDLDRAMIEEYAAPTAPDHPGADHPRGLSHKSFGSLQGFLAVAGDARPIDVFLCNIFLARLHVTVTRKLSWDTSNAADRNLNR